jgi:hypothetical protein
MINAIKVLLQMTSVSLQPVPSLHLFPFLYIIWVIIKEIGKLEIQNGPQIRENK